MAAGKHTLQKIVSLKRQKAEQDFQAVQQELDRVREAAEEITSTLRALDGQTDGADTLILAHRHGHVRKLISDLDAQRAAIAGKEAELLAAREVLKRAFDSEERLKD
ncbi:hypothetical protein [Hyphomonas johnsonii]|uniref:Uncharacterized protein n=1 Tax=Hyphomonas johnsonii MHS-2 TaxID=1280950 RepID=A0A059FP50_9PROT|nr:hypothetical protein [Hyphomonas johnsonii]KCZ92243.1 hypothetical protein HJO_09419 [Hyphomonas johnsonii MHS-2]